jgi:hypothetical protein
MATLADQQRLEADKARYQTEYKATIAERRRVIRELNNPRLTDSERNALNVQYEQLDNKAAQLDESAIKAETELNRVTNQINQSANPPIAGPGSEIPPYANQNTGGNPNKSTATRYQQAVADDQVRLNQANQGLANTNDQIAAAERERAALSAQLRAAAPGSPEQAAILARRNEINQQQADLETQQSALQDDIRVRENSLATNKNNLSLVEEAAPDRVSAPPPDPTIVTSVDGPVDIASQTAPQSQQTGDNVGYGEEDDAPSDQLILVRNESTTIDSQRYQVVFNPSDTTNGPYYIQDVTTGEIVTGGFQTETAAQTDANLLNQPDPNIPDESAAETARLEAANQAAADQDADTTRAAAEASTLAAARAQQAISAQQRAINQGDWRVRLRLANSADYLYQDPNLDTTSILQPLQVSGGVVFPYTPAITTAYRANYDQYDLTHSNFRGYFYKNSQVDPIAITARFTAQDTAEANYVLAVIHFFRSVTKMFYGQDPAYRGSPPPLVFLDGYGKYQFNQHPCVVASFQYNLPGDVDYIRADTANSAGLQNLLFRRDRADVPTNAFTAANDRLKRAGLPQGAEPQQSIPPSSVPTLGLDNPTYVPTDIEIEIELLPVQSRERTSREFSLKDFASGALVARGFW